MDYRILAILQEDGRISLSRLASKARISVPTARQRINKLIREGVIQRFTVLLDPKHLKGFDIFIGINASPAGVSAIAERLSSEEEVLGVYRTMGEHDLLIRLSLTSHSELDSFIANKLSKIKDVQSVKTSLVVGILKDEPSPRLKPGAGIIVYCAICGKEVTGEPIKRTIDGRDYYLCCNSCVSLFDQKTALGYTP